MSGQPVAFVNVDGVATITLDRADAGNAIDIPFARALREAVERCVNDDRVRCVVLTGAGKMFCVGGDVSEMAKAGDERPRYLDELIGILHEALTLLMEMRKPLVTLVNGAAAGAGFSLAMYGDIVLVAQSASFRAAYGAVGLTADGGMSWLLPRIVGLRSAQRIMLLNEKITAEEAVALGLANHVVADDTLTAEGDLVAAQLKSSSMQALGGVRTLLNRSFETSYEAQIEAERMSMLEAARSAENAEGIRAFLERRKPNFAEAL